MAKKKQARTDDAYYREDTWENAVTGHGKAGVDPRMATVIKDRRDLTEEELEALYNFDDLVGLVCDLPPREMLREWIDLSIPDDKDRESAVLLRLDELGVRKKLRQALTWQRLFGGGILVLGANDGSVNMRAPLNEESVKGIRWLKVLHMHDVEIEKRGEDGEITHWRVRDSGAQDAVDNTIIHASRLIIFDGLNVSRRKRVERKGWGMGVVDRMYDVLRDFNGAYGGLFASMIRMGESALRIEGLAKMLASEGGTSSVILSRIAKLSYYRRTYGFLPLDGREEVMDIAPSLGGANDVIDRLWMRLSSATRMPVTLLAGRSPSGLNATGESDMAQWYDNVKAEQEDTLRDPLERLIRLVLLEGGGKEPDAWSFKFRPLKQLTEAETAELRKTVAETDAIYLNAGVLSQEDVAASRWTDDGYSMDTTVENRMPPRETVQESEEDDDEEA